MSVANINIYKKNHCIRSTEQQPPKGRGKKKRISYGQADRKHLPPLPYGQFFVKNLLVGFSPYIMILCVLKRILHMKKSIFMQLLE